MTSLHMLTAAVTMSAVTAVGAGLSAEFDAAAEASRVHAEPEIDAEADVTFSSAAHGGYLSAIDADDDDDAVAVSASADADIDLGL